MDDGTITKDGELDHRKPLVLSDSQQQVLNAIMEGNSVFYTGAAGTGKSFILRTVRKLFTHIGELESVSFVAPTGIAACNINGLTIHSWAGIGLANQPVEQLIGRVIRNINARN